MAAILFYVYERFACMYVCVSLVCLMPMEVRRGCWIPDIVVTEVESCHVDTPFHHSAFSLPADHILCEAVFWTWQFIVVKIQRMK